MGKLVTINSMAANAGTYSSVVLEMIRNLGAAGATMLGPHVTNGVMPIRGMTCSMEATMVIASLAVLAMTRFTVMEAQI